MVKKKLLGINLILVALALAISIVAFSSIDRSHAWFALNDDVEGFGMSVSASLKAQVTASIKSYGVVDILEKDTIFVLGSKDSQGNYPELYDLPVVDPNNISYSQYEKALVVMVELVSTENINIDVLLNTPNTTPNLTGTNHFSNCIQVTGATFNGTQGRAVKDSLGTKSFVSVSNGNCTKINSITLSERIALKKDEPMSLCYVIEYNSAFIEYINSYILENGLAIVEVDYKNDITFTVTESIS